MRWRQREAHSNCNNCNNTQFHERDRILRKKIEEQDLADTLEKQERIRARKAEKRRIRRMEKDVRMFLPQQ